MLHTIILTAIIILYLYKNIASVPNLYFILDGFEKYTQSS